MPVTVQLVGSKALPEVSDWIQPVMQVQRVGHYDLRRGCCGGACCDLDSVKLRKSSTAQRRKTDQCGSKALN